MITTGVDIIKVDRIKKILDNKREAFYNKIFTEKEILYIQSKNNDPKTVATLFAAKEAISKALGTGIGKITWKDMEISHDKNGKPLVNLTQRTTYILNDLNINKFDISISHEEEFAVAFAIGYYSLTLEKEKTD